MQASRLASGLCLFFFKQKTAYEMSLRDWSSDVCSSDLAQKFEFKAGQIDVFAMDRNFMTRRIDYDRTGPQVFLICFPLASTQDRPNAQNHFPRTKRLRDVIVRAKFQANNPVDLFRFRCQHHDRNLESRRIGLQDLANFQTRHFRQHQIENNESRLFGPRFVQSNSPIGRRRSHETCFAQTKGEKIDNVPLVFDDENCLAGCRFHSQLLYRRNYFDLPAPAFTRKSDAELVAREKLWSVVG